MCIQCPYCKLYLILELLIKNIKPELTDLALSDHSVVQLCYRTFFLNLYVNNRIFLRCSMTVIPGYYQLVFVIFLCFISEKVSL